MQRFHAGHFGVEQGQSVLFSDVEHDGPMWTGRGRRETRLAVRFGQPFQGRPSVFLAPDMWDFDSKTNQRGDLRAERISETGFDIVFRTWSDTRVARLRVSWLALGAAAADEDWTLY